MRERKRINKIAGVFFWIAAWQILAMVMENAMLLPTPVRVIIRLFELMGTLDFWRITLTSIGRILLGTVLAMGLGIVLAMLTVSSSILEDLISPLMMTIQATPVASITILVLIWLDRDLVPVLICVMMVLPVVWNNVCAGIRSTDPQLLEMGAVYRLSQLQLIRRIYIPTVLPYFRAACSSALGLGWKAGIAAEVLTVPAQSIGRMISEAKLYLLTEELFAWTLMVVILSLCLQKLILRLLKGRNAHA